MKTLSDTEQQSAAVTKRNSSFLFDTLRQSAPYSLLIKAVEEMTPDKGVFSPIDISGLQGSLSSLLATALFAGQCSPLMVLSGQNSFELYRNDVEALLPRESICNTSDELSLSIGAMSLGKRSIILSFFDDLDVTLCKPAEAESRIFRLKNRSGCGI